MQALQSTNLEMKKQLDELVLQWSDTTINSQIQNVVFERLCLSTNLKSLTIEGYGGNKFPNWLGSSLFGNMVCLTISYCQNCSWLPPLGKLGNLKELFIKGMKSVKSVGTEFYGTSNSPWFQPFLFLETLHFMDMKEWEQWKLTGGKTTEFPRLTHLSLRGCPKLKGNIPLGQLGNLKELIVEEMESMKELGTEFYGSNSSPLFQPFPSLETLSVGHMQEWDEWKLIGGISAEFPSLTCLSLNNCPKLKGNIPGKLPSLTRLSLKYCPKLEGMAPNNLPSLLELQLIECPLLMESRHSDDNNNIIVTRQSSDVFRKLVISLNSLQKMTLYQFPSLTSFPRDGLPKTLQSLSIDDCKNLELLPHETFHKYKSLENLSISSSCDAMTSFTLCSLPVLKSLHIKFCKKLKSILIAEDVSQQNLLLRRNIVIEGCDELESVSFRGFPIPNLIHFEVLWCKKLRYLPEPINTLSIFQEMDIGYLPNLQSFVIDDLPISLRELSVGDVGGILWNTNLEHLTSLSVLRIRGDEIVKLLMKTEVPLLPVSLISLEIDGVKYIECLDGNWLHHLSSLQSLQFSFCVKLKSLPEEKKFPSCLKVLRISVCPILEESLRRKRGKEWRKIAHIPFVLINNEMLTFVS